VLDLTPGIVKSGYGYIRTSARGGLPPFLLASRAYTAHTLLGYVGKSIEREWPYAVRRTDRCRTLASGLRLADRLTLHSADGCG